MRRYDRAGRVRVVALLLCALLVRAVVPTGWMPAVSAQGLSMAMCSGKAITLPLGGGQDGDGQHSAPDQPCAFAGLTLAADAAPPFALAATAPFAPPRPAELTEAAIGRGLAAPPPPSTGPPAFA